MHLLELLNNNVVSELLLSYTPAEALSRLCCVNRKGKQLVETYYTHRFRCLVATYFTDVDAFLELLRKAEGCITGSSALKLLVNDAAGTWTAKDLDISVPSGQSCHICSFLQTEGYAVAEGEADEPWTSTRLAYYQMLKRQRLKSVVKLKGKEGRCIDVLESSSQDCISPLCEFHSTAVVNALYPDKLTCFFPAQTLRYRSIPNAATRRLRDRKAVQKYAERGWLPIPGWSAVLEEDLLHEASWSVDVSLRAR